MGRRHDPASGANPALRSVTLEEVHRRLELFLQGLGGRRLHIEPAGEPYTDSEVIYLPTRVDRFPDRDSNYALYKAMTVHLWAQARFGTWRVPAFLQQPEAGFDAAHFWRLGAWEAVGLSRGPGSFVEPARLVALFHALETRRLDACIVRELPGMGRILAGLRKPAAPESEGAEWRSARTILRRPDASVADSYGLLACLYPLPLPDPRPYQGVMRPETVERIRDRRVRREEEAFRKRIAAIDLPPATETPGENDEPRTRGHRSSDASLEGETPAWTPEALDELAAEGAARGLMDSIVQDLGEVPRRYLDAEGDGLYLWNPDAERDSSTAEEAVAAPGVHRYPEWDYRRREYHRHWCRLLELDVSPGDPAFVTRTRDKYRGLLKELQRTFSQLREEDRLLRRQREGDDVDLDAVVAGWPDRRRGEEAPLGLYVKRHKRERDIAVLFLVDMSGSTRGWVNEAEREALILLCEALQSLDDRYAVYGFTGMTRQRCEIYRVKTFDQSYDEAVRARISGIAAGEYTRMGVAIRHLSNELAAVDARVRLLVTISDGKPDDFDGYSGRYGIEDTRQALAEAGEMGLHTYCITIDREARDYLSHLYGPSGYAVVDDVAALPREVADIYRRITS